jgi:S1-C subfamily serine protease
MTTSTLAALSDELAERTAAAAPFVVQVIGGRRPASGVVHDANTIVTTARALGREDGLQVRLAGGAALDADLAGWDPATGVAVLRTRTPVDATAPQLAKDEARPGQIVLALARSWSNVITVSSGIVAVVGGPLRTGRRRQIQRVIRITAPIHDGFAGGALIDASGALAGITTASSIRGFAVAIPAAIAWASAAQVASAGTPRRGFVGVAVQAVALPASQRRDGRERALLVMGITPGSPAEQAGILVGDVILQFAGQAVEAPDDLLDLLTAQRPGQAVPVQLLRGDAVREIQIAVSERPER